MMRCTRACPNLTCVPDSFYPDSFSFPSRSARLLLDLGLTGGSVSGLVGAGGNLGAIAFTLVFLSGQFASTAAGFRVMGWVVMAVSSTVWLLRPSLLDVDPLDLTLLTVSALEEGEGEAPTETDSVELTARA